MLEIRDLPDDDAELLLARIGFGHLALAMDNEPYVVPINYAYAKPDIYFYTTRGKKTEILSVNPRVCLQIEDLDKDGCWRSVVVNGTAELVTDWDECHRAVKMMLDNDLELLAATAVRWEKSWIKASVEAVYKIKPDEMTGRSSTKLMVRSAVAVP